MLRVHYINYYHYQHNHVAEKPKYTMCYLGELSRFDRDEQLSLCHKIVEELELAPFNDRIFEAHELEHFINELRGNEAAIVPLLDLLADKKGTGVGIRFFINERKLHDACQFIVSLDTTKPRAIADLVTVRSDAGRDWYRLLAKTGNSVMRGRPLKKKDAKAKARKRYVKPGLTKNWQLKEGTPEYITMATIWGNLDIKPAGRAIKMFPDDELCVASQPTIERIFGSRTECLEWLNKLST